ncbi:hypothetical protein [Helicobacter cetorum]|uniref:Uncharacterized protein n=1 Tax=Helicobacter cetorum (strain ATCC BAA-540 / CCUG 52418 / MIT 99-5656) TaxID=1163745 RepID=I0ERC3_HELCM|nr:hypothetical protein [Helicobacter cetorum]AFI05492.1 hypothetical protein HCD_02360 [Helicobacter cetorum MIT 99-5656]
MFQGLGRIFKDNFCSQVYISFNVDHNVSSIQVIRIKNHNVKENFLKTFETKNGEVPIQILKIARTYGQKYPYTYFSAMSKAKEVLCNKEVFQQLKQENPKEEYRVCEVNQKYCAYVEPKDFLRDFKRFKIQDIDFLFSPFSLIYCFVRDSLESKPLLYLLMERSRFYFLIADKKEIFLAKSVFLEEQPEEFVPSQEEDSMEISNEAMNMFLSEIQEDIDNLEEAMNLDSDKESMEKAQEDAYSLIAGMTNIPIVADVLQESLRSVYNSRDMDFVEKVVLLDSCQIHQKALLYLQEYLMMEVSKLSFSLVEQLNILARMENDTYAF